MSSCEVNSAQFDSSNGVEKSEARTCVPANKIINIDINALYILFFHYQSIVYKHQEYQSFEHSTAQLMPVGNKE
jgi:hypothetical protein